MPSDRLLLLQTVLCVARSDDHFADEERDRLRQLMRFLRLNADDCATAEAMMAEDAPLPNLPDVADLPDYDTRLYFFHQAVLMGFADGKILPAERESLGNLAKRLDLKPADTAKAWTRAEEFVR